MYPVSMVTFINFDRFLVSHRIHLTTEEVICVEWAFARLSKEEKDAFISKFLMSPFWKKGRLVLELSGPALPRAGQSYLENITLGYIVPAKDAV